MSPKLPCLFCFSNANQEEGHQHQGDKSQRDQIYQFLRSLLGIRISPAEEFDHLSDDAFLPLCLQCSLIFRNLSELHDQLLNTQNEINLVVQDIKTKIKHSDGDSTSALAVAIQSIDDDESFVKPVTSLTSSTLTWIQQFRQKVGKEDIGSTITQNVLFVTGIQQLYDENGQGMVYMTNEGYTVSDGSTILYLVQKPVTSSPDVDHEEVGMDMDHYCQDTDQGDEEDDHNTNQGFDSDVNDTEEDDGTVNHINTRLRIAATKSKPTRTTTAKKVAAKSKPSSTIKSGKSTKSKPTRISKTGKTAAKSKPTLISTKSSSIRKEIVTNKRKQSPKIITTTKNKRVTNSPAPPKLSDKEMSRHFKCEHCPWTFDKIHQLKAHTQTHATDQNKQKFICQECNQEFTNRRAIQKHNAKHHGDIKPFKCPKCTTTRSTSDALENHMKVHDDTIQGPPWICTICPDSPQFIRRLNLKRHLSNHSQSKKFPCPLCTSVFSRKEDMMRHMMKKHKDMDKKVVEGRTFSCNICKNKFPSVAELMAHMWSHGSAFQLTCRLCNKSFKTLDHLTKHNEKDHGFEAKRFTCSTCGLTLVTDRLLKLHMKLHTPDPAKEQQLKKKACKDDEETEMSDSDNASWHESDSSEPPSKKRAIVEETSSSFDCDICDKSFETAGCLRNHERADHFLVFPTLRLTRTFVKPQKPDVFPTTPSFNSTPVGKVQVIVTTLDSSGPGSKSATKTIFADLDVGHKSDEEDEDDNECVSSSDTEILTD